MKSFIETQRALLAEIQNGCKRNFILAKEKEETEMRQSASMAEIATEDGTRAEEEESASEESQPKEDKREEDDEEQPASESQTSAESSFRPPNLDSDSDTEDEEEEELVTNCSATASAPAHLKQTPEIQTGPTQPHLSASHTPSSPSVLPTGGPSVIPGITVTESAPPPGAPPSPGRCISVSSPGRGRKIFMVTRVESPPEEQQQSASAPPSQSTEDSKTAVEVNITTTQRTQSQHSSPTPTQTRLAQEAVKEHSPAPSSDSQARVDGPPHTHARHPQSADGPTEDVTPSTLVPDAINPSQQAPSQPSDPSATPLTEEAAEPAQGAERQHEGRRAAKEQLPADGTQAETDEGGVGKRTQVESQQEQQPAEELASVTEETPSPNQAEAQQGARDRLSETGQPSLVESSREQVCPRQQNGLHREAVGAAVTQQEAASPAASTPPQSNPSAGGDSNAADPVALESSPSGSADKRECSAEAVEDAAGSALPNGLKAEFSLHLLEAESPKSGSCAMDHGESLCSLAPGQVWSASRLKRGCVSPVQ